MDIGSPQREALLEPTQNPKRPRFGAVRVAAPTEALLARMVEAQAQLLGYRDAFLVTALVCLLAILPGQTMRQPPPGLNPAARPTPPPDPSTPHPARG